jgi:hypothetical protein
MDGLRHQSCRRLSSRHPPAAFNLQCVLSFSGASTPSAYKDIIYVHGFFVTFFWSAGVSNLQVLALFNDRAFFLEPSIVQLTQCLEVPSKIGALFW